MNGQDLYEGLRFVDPALLEEAAEPVKRPKRRRYLPLAACLCLLLAGTAGAVLHSVEIRMLDVEHLEDYQDAPGMKKTIENRSADQAYQAAAQVEIKDPYYRHIADPRTAEHILREFGLSGEGSHIVNGHVPVRAIEGESPIKGGGRLIIIDGGFCRAYHRRTGIAGYTLVYNSRGLILRTHQPFESVDKAIHEDEDIASKSEYIYTAPQRILVRDTDEGGRKQALIRDLTALVEAYQSGVIAQGVAQEM